MTNYHVATTGDDGNDGSLGSPWRNIRTKTGVLRPGDILDIHAGVYYESGVVIRNAGTPSAPITIRNYGTDVVWIDGQTSHTLGVNNGNPGGDWWTPQAWKDGTYDPDNPPSGPYNPTTNPPTFQKMTNYVAINASWIIWDGVNVRNSAGRLMNIHSISYGDPVTDVVVRNTELYWARNSALVAQVVPNGHRPNRITIEHCKIHHAGEFYPGYRDVGKHNHPGGCTFNGIDNLIFRYNEVCNNFGEAWLFDTVNGGAETAHVHDNTFYDNMWGVYIHAASNVTFERNIIYHTNTPSHNGINWDSYYCLGIQASENPITPVNPVNNTVVRNNLIIAGNGKAGEGMACINMAGNTWGWDTDGDGALDLFRPYIDNLHIYNNTLIGRGSTHVINHTALPHRDFFFRGNIFHQLGSGDIWRSTYLNDNDTLSHNASNKSVSSKEAGSDNFVGDVQMVNPAAVPTPGQQNWDNYKLQPTSPVKGNSWIQPSSVTGWLDYEDDLEGGGRGTSGWSRGSFQDDPGAPPSPPDPEAGKKDIVFVATDGDDQTGDGEELTPVATFARAQELVTTGGTIYVREGIYTEVVTIFISGAIANRTTIKAYENEVVWIDGQAPVVSEGGISGPYEDCTNLPTDINIGQPAGAPVKCNPVTGAYFTNGGMLNVNGSYLNLEGINVANSMGRGVRIFPASGDAEQRDVTVTRCAVTKSRGIGVLISTNDFGAKPNNIKFINGRVVESGSYNPTTRDAGSRTEWVPAILVTRASYVEVTGNLLHDNWGEALVGDSKDGATTNLIFRGNTVYDNWKPVRVHGVLESSTVEGNVFYRTDEYEEPHLVVQATQRPVGDASWGNGVETVNCLVYNNLFVDGYIGISVYGTVDNPYMRRVQIYNNTIIDQSRAGVLFASFNNEDMSFKNNIVLDCPVPVEVAGSYPADWASDYNSYSVPPSVGSGPNDIIGDPLLIDKDHRPDPTSRQLIIENFDLTDLSPVIAEGENYYQYTGTIEDILGRIRAPYAEGEENSPWDIGAYTSSQGEVPVPPTVTAIIGVDTYSGEAPLTVQFTDNSVATGGAVITNRYWSFGDGNYSEEANPQHTYQNPGNYQAVLRAWDASTAAEGTINSPYIKVDASDPVTGGDIQKVVLHEEIPSGSLSKVFPHGLGVVPKYAELVTTFNRTTLGDVEDVEIVFGATDGTYEFAVWNYIEHGSYINAIRASEEGAAVRFSTNGNPYTWAATGTVTWDATNVTITFDQQTPVDARIRILVLGGDGVEVETGKIIAPANATHIQNLSFTPSYVNLWSNFTSLSTPRAHATMVIGKICTNSQGSIAFEVRNNSYPIRVANGVFTEQCLANPLYTSYEITGAIATELFSLTGSANADSHRTLFYAAIKIGDAESQIHDITLPDDPSNIAGVTYPIPHSTSHVEVLYAGRQWLNDFDSNRTTNQGLGHLAVVDSNDLMVVMTEQPGATDSQSYTDMRDRFHVLKPTDHFFSYLSGEATIEPTGLRVDWVSVPDVPYKSLLFSVAETGGLPDVPQALFYVEQSQYSVLEDVGFTNHSSPNATSFLWDFGDDTTSTDPVPTKSYTEPGLYTVSLTATNANGSNVYTKMGAVNVIGEEPSIDFSVVPDTGEAPLSTVLSDLTVPGNGMSIIKWHWMIAARADYSGVPGSDPLDDWGSGFDTNAVSFQEFINDTGEDIPLTLYNIDQYVVRLLITQNDSVTWQLTRIPITVEPNLPVVSFSLEYDSGLLVTPVTLLLTDTSDLKGEEVVSSLWHIVGPTLDVEIGNVNEASQLIVEPGTYTIERYVETYPGSDSSSQEIVISDGGDCIIGPTVPLSVSTTSENLLSSAGHAHAVIHSSRGEANTIASFDDNGWMKAKALSAGADPQRLQPFPANLYEGNDFPEILAPITSGGYVQAEGLMHNAGSLVLRSFHKMLIETVAQQISPINPNTERLGSDEYPFLSIFVNTLEAALLAGVNRISGNGGDIITGRTDSTMAILDSSEDVSNIIVRHNIFKAGDVLVITNGSSFEYMKVKSLKFVDEELPPIYDQPGNEDEEHPFVEEPVYGTVYSVERGQYGSSSQRWLAGTLVVALGFPGDVLIESYGSHSLEARIASGGISGQGVGPGFAVKERNATDPVKLDVTFFSGLIDDAYGFEDPTNVTVLGKADGPHIVVAEGKVCIFNLPTTEPVDSNVLWLDENGFLKVTT